MDNIRPFLLDIVIFKLTLHKILKVPKKKKKCILFDKFLMIKLYF